MGNPILQVTEKGIRYLCTVIADEKTTDLSNSEECGVHCVLGNIIFTRGSATSTTIQDETFAIPLNSVPLFAFFGNLFSNLATRSSFVVLRPVFYNGFTNTVPDMVRVYVRTSAVDSIFDKKGLPALEKMCAEQVFSDTMQVLASKFKIVIETSDLVCKGLNTSAASADHGKILVSQRTTAAQNKSEVTLRGKVSPEQRQNAESMLNTIITAGYKESQRSLAYVPWIEVTDNVVVNTRSWSLERNPLATVPLTKIQAVSRSEYTERFSDTLGFLLCPRGSGRRRTVSACFSMLNSSAHDSDIFMTNRKRTHSDISYLSLSTCLIVCKEESMDKWKEELEVFVDVLALKSVSDLETVTREKIKGTTILLSTTLIATLNSIGAEITAEIRDSTPNLQFPLSLNDERIRRLYVNDIVERFGQSIIPLQWIHFRCILFDDLFSTSLDSLPHLKADWTWISHVSDEPMCFLPPQTLLRYADMSPHLNWKEDFLFKWRLLQGEGCVISFSFPRVILHKVLLKTQKVQISRQENLFLSVIKSLAEQQLGGKVPSQGLLKKSDYAPILLGCDALNANGCSMELCFSRKQAGSLMSTANVNRLESNLEQHFAPPSGGTTFAQKLMGCERLKLVASLPTPNSSNSNNSNDKGGSKFVIDSLRKSIDGEAVCGVCYCDPVEIFCLCGHGYCKTCTDIFSRANTLVVNCPTCRLPLCPFDWIQVQTSAQQQVQLSSTTETSSIVGDQQISQQQQIPQQQQQSPPQMLNFSAFGGSYQAMAASYKTLSRVNAILNELNAMFKTRSKLYASSPGCILAAPNKSLKALKTLLTLHSDGQYSFELGFADPTAPQRNSSTSTPLIKTSKSIQNPEDENEATAPHADLAEIIQTTTETLPTPPTPRSLSKLTSSLSSSFKKKVSTPRIILMSFSDFASLNVDTIDLMIMGIIFATPPPPVHSKSYITATRLASQSYRSTANAKNLNLIVLYTSEFEEQEMMIAKRMLKREDVEPKPRSHSNSFSGSGDKSPKR